MSEYLGKSVASEAPGADARDFASFPASNRFVAMGSARRIGSRLDLGRSWRRHRSLALAPAMTGMIAAMVFLAMRWTSDAPVNSATWVDQLEIGPGVLLFALGGALLGLVAAWLASLCDRHVYSAYDVERLLGVSPLAELPDFDQVSVGVAKEHLLRLTGAIEQARLTSRLKNCLFTGAGPGVGASTVAARVRETMEEMERQTVLLDASTTPPPQSILSQSRERGVFLQATSAGRSGVMLRRLAEESREEQTLVLTDAAPLTEAAGTEVLARFVDAVIVVIESGVTTRRQLRETAEVLRRLQIGTAGFVLNRIRLEKADSDYRASVRRTEERLQSQSRTISRRPSRHQPLPMEWITPAAQEENAASLHSAAARAYAQAVSRLSPQPMDPPLRQPAQSRFQSQEWPAVNPAQSWQHPAMRSSNPAAEGAFVLPVVMPRNGLRENSFVEGLGVLHQRAQIQKTVSIFRDDPPYDPPDEPVVAPPLRQPSAMRPVAYATPLATVSAAPEISSPPSFLTPASNLSAMPMLRLDPRQPFDEIQILPPRRGQYRGR